ncbi:hypothetical protein Emag_004323 [Eimeria magna]
MQQLHPRLQAHIRTFMTAQPDPSRTPYEHMVAILIQQVSPGKPEDCLHQTIALIARRTDTQISRLHMQFTEAYDAYRDLCARLRSGELRCHRLTRVRGRTPPPGRQYSHPQREHRPQDANTFTLNDEFYAPPASDDSPAATPPAAPRAPATAPARRHQRTAPTPSEPSDLSCPVAMTRPPAPSLGRCFFCNAPDHGHHACPSYLRACQHDPTLASKCPACRAPGFCPVSCPRRQYFIQSTLFPYLEADRFGHSCCTRADIPSPAWFHPGLLRAVLAHERPTRQAPQQPSVAVLQHHPGAAPPAATPDARPTTPPPVDAPAAHRAVFCAAPSAPRAPPAPPAICNHTRRGEPPRTPNTPAHTRAWATIDGVRSEATSLLSALGPAHGSVTGVNNHTLQVLGRVALEVRIGPLKTTAPFFVVPGVAFAALLGVDSLYEHEIAVSLARHALIFEGHAIHNVRLVATDPAPPPTDGTADTPAYEKVPGGLIPTLPSPDSCLLPAELQQLRDLLHEFRDRFNDEEDRPKTSFVTPDCQRQYRRLPFGFASSPAIFQRMVDLLLGGVKRVSAVGYINDIIVYSDTWDAHRPHLRQRFQAVRDADLQLHPGKCSFGAAAVRYLGHIVSRDVIKPCPSKVQAILEMPVPKTAKAVQRFLGKCQYYRKFIPTFSITAEPLFQAATRQKDFTWTPAADTALRTLCKALSSEPALAHPDYKRPFCLDCDGSGDGLGAVLLQPYYEGERVVAYASRSLLDHERKWTATELKAAALIWALETFNHYIDTIQVCIRTDHAPLEYIRHNSSQCRLLERWELRLQEFRFKVIHRPGAQQKHVDCLSRASLPPTPTERPIILDEFPSRTVLHARAEHPAPAAPSQLWCAPLCAAVDHVARSAHRRMRLPRHRSRHLCAAVRAVGPPAQLSASGSDDDADVQPQKQERKEFETLVASEVPEECGSQQISSGRRWFIECGAAAEAQDK